MTTPNKHEPVTYMARSHAYYAAQGFSKAYQYAQHDDAPFTPLSKPLAQCRLGLVTTASTYQRVPLEPRKVDSGYIEPPPKRLYADDLSWDKQATHLDDIHSYFPLCVLQANVNSGQLGSLATRFHCAPTEYSQSTTLTKDAPEIHRRLLEDEADIALLVPL